MEIKHKILSRQKKNGRTISVFLKKSSGSSLEDEYKGLGAGVGGKLGGFCKSQHER